MALCIVKSKSEELKRAFKSGELSLTGLFELGSSAKRIEVLSKYVGDAAEFVNVKFEKAFVSPAQKLAFRNLAFELVGQGKPLYKGLTIKDAQKMADGLNIRELKGMTNEQLVSELSKFVDKEMAINLASKYERLKKSGNLANWEERVLGTKELREDKKLKGSLVRIEVLDDLGVLTPAQTEDFMQSLIKDKLGVNLTQEEAIKLSELTKEQSDAFNKLVKEDNWTWKNEADIMDYFTKRNKLEEYTQTLEESNIPNTLIDIARANILASPRILKNSFLYQVLPGLERTISKRLVSGNMNSGDLNSNIIEKMQAKLSGIVPNKGMREFIKKQTVMAIRIYHKTGYDISRMTNLDEGFRFFGEKFSGMQGIKFGEAKGIKEKFGAGLRAYGRVTNLAPKWMAGGTDILFANVGRADTATMMSKEIASLEAKKGKLPQGVTQEQRANQLLEESYSFNPKDAQAEKIREIAIQDAHMMNGTQYSKMADKLLKFRNGLGLGNIKFGKAIIPFLKIPATVKAEGLKTVSGVGIIRSIKQINNAVKFEGVERSKQMQKGVSNLIRYLGFFMGAALFITTLLDDDDYIGAWDTIGYKQYGLARARGGGTSMIRIGGKWIPLRYLPIIDIPIAAIMSARQAKTRGGDYFSGALQGIVGQIFEIPGVKETKEWIQKKLGKLAKSDNKEDTLEAMGLNAKLLDWAKVRFIPSLISYDLYNKIIESEAKFDFMGNEIDKTTIIGFRDDKSNEITAEFQRLDNAGVMPVISDPTSDYVGDLVSGLSQQGYEDLLNELKKKNADEMLKLFDRSKYKKANDEEKKELINKERQDNILDRLKKEAKKYD